MRHIYFTPGPSQLYPGVDRFLRRAIREEIGSLSHRSKKFQDILNSLTKGLHELFSIPQDHAIIYLSSATEAMERIIQNTVEKESLHIVTGAFGKRMFEIAKEMQKNPKLYEVEDICDLSLTDVPIAKTTELLCFTHTETGNGTAHQMEEIYLLKNNNPKKLLSLDVVSSIPYLNIDYSLIDIVFFSVQKGFGLPPGLGVVILSPQALEKAKRLSEKNYYTGSYHSFPYLVEHMKNYQTPETPNTLGIYLFEKVVQAMRKKGITALREETDKKANMLYDFFDHHSSFTPVILNKKIRSKTCIVIETGEKTKALLDFLKSNYIVVGTGYGKMKDRQIRIANFPAISVHDVQDLIDTLSSFGST